MRLHINGESQDFNENSLTLAQLVAHLEFVGERIAVELNREVIRRQLWNETALKDNDKIEIVHFVGGGG